MESGFSRRRILTMLCCGLAGCVLMGGSDWLMIYGNTAYAGGLAWLTDGAAHIAPWRNTLAMVLAFPAVAFYAAALLAVRHLLIRGSERKTYSALTVLGLTPWLCLHLFYVMILYLFSWLQKAGQTALSYSAAEALFAHFSWIVLAGEAVMLLPFLYLFAVTLRGHTVYPRGMAFNNPLILYLILKILTGFLPDCAARLAFVNGLMSEAMAIWFLILMLALPKAAAADR